MLSINLFFVIIVALIMDYVDKQHYYKCVDKHIYGYSCKDFQNKKVWVYRDYDTTLDDFYWLFYYIWCDIKRIIR